MRNFGSVAILYHPTMETDAALYFVIHRREDEAKARRLAEELEIKGFAVVCAYDDADLVLLEEGMLTADCTLILLMDEGHAERWQSPEYLAMVERVTKIRGESDTFIVPVWPAREASQHPNEDLFEAVVQSIDHHVGQPRGDQPTGRSSAEALHEEAESLEELGMREESNGNAERARDLRLQSIALRERLAALDPTDLGLRREVAAALERIAEVNEPLEDARDLSRRAIRVWEALVAATPGNAGAQRDLALALERYADREVEAGDLGRAVELMHRSMEICEVLATAAPQSRDAQRELSVTLTRLAELSDQNGEWEASRAYYRWSTLPWERWIAANDWDLEARISLVELLSIIGELEQNQGTLEAARAVFTRVVELVEVSSERQVSSRSLQLEGSTALRELAAVEVEAGALAPARQHLDRALNIVNSLVDTSPDDIDVKYERAAVFHSWSLLEFDEANYDGARAYCLRALEILEELAAGRSGLLDDRIDLAHSLQQLARIEGHLGHESAAREVHRRVLDIIEEHDRKDPGRPDIQGELVRALSDLAQIELGLGDNKSLRDLAARAHGLAETLAASGPRSHRAQRDLATACMRMCAAADEEGLAWMMRALSILRDCLERFPDRVVFAEDLASVLLALGHAAIQIDDADTGRRAFLSAHQLFEWLHRRGSLKPRKTGAAQAAKTLASEQGALRIVDDRVVTQASMATPKKSPAGGLPTASAQRPKISRNAPCPCGSGKKFKKCCMPVH